MIIDSFMYLNEIECLDIRLHELYDVVDVFLLCESNITHTGKEKPFHFSDEQYTLIDKKFHDKIHVVKCFDQDVKYGYEIEYEQRDQMGKEILKLATCNHDYIILGDVDEIPNGRDLRNQVDLGVNSVCFAQTLYYYYINCVQNQIFNGSVLIKRDSFQGGQATRNLVGYINKIRGGWHFSYLGGAQRVKYKLESIRFPEDMDRNAFTDIEEIKSKIYNNLDIVDRTGEQFEKTIVAIDSTYPSCIQEVIKKYPYIVKAV